MAAGRFGFGRMSALAFAGLLVLAAVAVPGAAIGAGEAGTVGDEISRESSARTTVDGGVAAVQERFQAKLASGESYWRGWRLLFDASRIVPADAGEGARTFQIRRVDVNGKVGELVREFTVAPNGKYRVRTAKLPDRVVIQYEGDPVYVRDGVGYRSSPPDGTAVTVANSAWRTREQTLGASWSEGDEGAVYGGQVTHLTIESNRDRYTVAVSARGLGFDDLKQLFEPAAYARNYDARKDDGVILLDATDRTRFRLNVTGIPNGTYRFQFDVIDAASAAYPRLTVKSPGGARFLRVERVEHVGDIVETTVACDSCYLIIGGAELNFLHVMQVADTTGDGEVTIRLNMRYFGVSRSEGVPSDVERYTAGPDKIELHRPIHQLANGRRLDRVQSTIGVDPGGRSEPLGPGTYDLTLATSDALELPYETLKIRDVSDIASIELVEPSLDGMRSYITTPGQADGLTLADVRSLPQRDRVVLGDRLVLAIDGSGLHGYLDARYEGDVRVLTRGPGLDLSVSDTRLYYDRTEAALLIDEENDRVYVVYDTRSLQVTKPVRTGETYEFVLTRSALPGMDATEPESVRTTVTFVEPSAHVHSRTRGSVQVMGVQSARVTGNTTLAPGSTLTLRASPSGGGAWEKTTTTTVERDGSWTATFDFTNVDPGGRFTVAVVHESETLTTAEGRVVTSTPTPVPTPTPRPGGSTGAVLGSVVMSLASSILVSQPAGTPAVPTLTPVAPGETPQSAPAKATEKPSNDGGSTGDGSAGESTPSTDGGSGLLPGLGGLPMLALGIVVLVVLVAVPLRYLR